MIQKSHYDGPLLIWAITCDFYQWKYQFTHRHTIIFHGGRHIFLYRHILKRFSRHKCQEDFSPLSFNCHNLTYDQVIAMVPQLAFQRYSFSTGLSVQLCHSNYCHSAGYLRALLFALWKKVTELQQDIPISSIYFCYRIFWFVHNIFRKVIFITIWVEIQLKRGRTKICSVTHYRYKSNK